MMNIKSTLHMVEHTSNTKRKFGSTKTYYPAYLKLGNGDVVPALFTENQIWEARERATQNPEDVPPRAGFFARLFSF